ncbi:hypothetical protein CYY_005887 [Polysphondylium violaceum]|uniref:Folylpolyglutamate synthase n=1 Tax=Polysphondylium violaceum TaxID=133409 RepID=A0A8J4PRB3_9MYCE|nr:hypothetical protein CYY_005887 [Polysphondylium violaceum]
MNSVKRFLFDTTHQHLLFSSSSSSSLSRSFIQCSRNNRLQCSSNLFINRSIDKNIIKRSISGNTTAANSNSSNSNFTLNHSSDALNSNSNKNIVDMNIHIPVDNTYEEAINTLLSLQSNQGVILSWINQRKNDKEGATKILLEDMLGYCRVLNINLNDKQSVIHVAGTKGKGSTCALVESLIRNQGFSTGLFTSPHLLSPRERIRINGDMISKELFTKYFWIVWDTLRQNYKDQEMPNFFKFLTLLALKTFQEENIECTILEVGIGGRMDSTNIFPRPVATGISALGYDHMNVLGDTLQEIAGEKAGIMKTDIPVFTVSSQPSEAMEVLVKQSKTMSSPLCVAPSLSEYGFNDKISLDGQHQRENCALALALANCWLSKQTKIPLENIYSNVEENKHQYKQYQYNINNYSSAFFKPLSPSIQKAITTCEWAGRAQHYVMDQYPNIDFYLDGAHTPESSLVCLEWWKTVVNSSATKDSDKDTHYIFVYNSTGGRNPKSFLQPFITSIKDKEIPMFDLSIIPSITIDKTLDKNSMLVEKAQVWEDFVVKCFNELSEDSCKVVASKNVDNCLESIIEYSDNGKKKVKVLVTGSLYLVGNALKFLMKDKAFN